MSVISSERNKAGLSQAALAECLGVSASAVAQWEASEQRGTIQLGTLAKALSGMGKTLVVEAETIKPLLPLTWDQTRLTVLNPVESRQCVLDAFYGNRIPAIVGECWNLGVRLSVEELWLVADRISVDTSLQVWNQARMVRDSYDKLVTSIRKGSHIPVMITPSRVRIPAPIEHTPAAIIGWALTGIRNQVPWLDAYRQAGALLIQSGHPWPVLPTTDEFRQAWEEALGILIVLGDGDPLVALFNVLLGENHG